MTLTELLDKTASTVDIPPSRLKDLKTSIRYLAKALGHSTPDQCHDRDFLLEEAGWKARLNDYLGTIGVSPHTVRNTRNNLSYLFRQAIKAEIIVEPTRERPRLLKRPGRGTDNLFLKGPYRQHYQFPRYLLTFEHWSPPLKDGWNAYQKKRQKHLRQTTVGLYERLLSSYIGYLVGIEQVSLTHWMDLFSCEYLDKYVCWHSQQANVDVSTQAYHVCHMLRSIAKYEKYEQVQAITDYLKDLKKPEPMHDKHYHWVSLQELEQISLTLQRESRIPLAALSAKRKATARPGIHRAATAAKSLMLRILVRIPFRQGNLRGMKLDENLCRENNQWYIRFKGHELKVARRNGGPNNFTLNLSEHFPELVEHLEEYLRQFRPLLPNAEKSPYVFLTTRGNPYTAPALSTEIRDTVYVRTQKRFFPHLIRTIYNTEMIELGMTIETVAAMMNDSPTTAWKRYYENRIDKHAVKASGVLRDLFAKGNTGA